MPLWTALIRRVARPEDARTAGRVPTDHSVRRSGNSLRIERAWPWTEWILVSGAIAFVLWLYAWTISINSGFDDWGELDYYRLQVRGWMKGQLHLDKDPAPELLALADPYDPFQNAPYKLGDATFYRGRYYIYFGAAPAATLMLPYRLLTGRELSTGAATLVLCSVAFLAASALWLALRRRYFPGSLNVVAAAGVLAIGFGTHLLALAQRPMFWELAIAGGIAFSTLAAAAAYWAIHGRRPLVAMAAAGLGVGLAVGSRPTCLLAAPLLLAPVWLAWREHRGRSAAEATRAAPRPNRTTPSWLKLAVAAAVPLLVCGTAIMAHNYARFHHPFEFGQHYQLSGAHEGKLTHFSLSFLPHNLRVYFLHRLAGDVEFPFVAATKVPVPDIAGYFGSEEVSGLAATFPFYWFLLGLPLAWWRRERHEARRLSAAVATVAGYGIPVMLVVLCYFSTTMRYEADFAVALAVLALTGMLALERRVAAAPAGEARSAPASRSRPAAQRWIAAVAVLASGATVLAGILVAFDYHGRALFTANFPLWRELVEVKHEVVRRAAHWAGASEGPRVLKVRFRPQTQGRTETLWESADPRVRERIVVQHTGEQLIRFGYARGGAPLQWGDEREWQREHTHTVSLQLPSLYPPTHDGGWARLRRHEAFRERTAVAVWFSGGRALASVAEPLPAGLVPGGRVSREFSGEIRKLTTRPFRADEIASGPAAHYERRGGILQMRVIFPPTFDPRGEPLFSSGERPRSTMLFVEPAAGGVRIVFQNSDEPRVESAVVSPDPRGHRLEIELPTFDPRQYGWEARGDVVVRVDGREVLRTNQMAAPYLAGTEQFGRNLFGTTCGSHFGGWIFDVQWLATGDIRAPAR